MPRQNEIAEPTIAEVLADFLAEQKDRLSSRYFANYVDVVELLQHHLNGYAYQTLDKREKKLFERLFNATDSKDQREFCEIFGPEYILPEIDMFLGYFMVHKVSAGQDFLRASGTVIRTLAKWLDEKGYAGSDEAANAARSGAAASRDLPKAEKLAQLLHELAASKKRGSPDDELEGRFTITRVEPRKLWLEDDDPSTEPIGPITLPESILRHCKVGWVISGVVGKVGKTWRLADAWNVYPG